MADESDGMDHGASEGVSKEEEAGGGGLAGRLTAQRVYLNTLSSNASGSSKSIYASEEATRLGEVGAGGTGSEEQRGGDDDQDMDLDHPDLPFLSASVTLRPSALHLFFGIDAGGATGAGTAPALAVTTADIFQWTSAWSRAVKPVGLEWIDDVSCNVLYKDPVKTRDAFLHLSDGQEEEAAESGATSSLPHVEDEIERLAREPPSEPVGRDFYDLQRDPASPLLRWKRARALLVLDPGSGSGSGSEEKARRVPTLIRYATTADVKRKGAASRSRFYQRHGRTTASLWNAQRERQRERERGRDDRDRRSGPRTANEKERPRGRSASPDGSRDRIRTPGPVAPGAGAGGMYSATIPGDTVVLDDSGQSTVLSTASDGSSARARRAQDNRPTTSRLAHLAPSRLADRLSAGPGAKLSLEEQLARPL